YRLMALVKSQIGVLEESAWKTRYMVKFNRQFKGISSGGGGQGGLVEMPKRLTAGEGDGNDDS
ncbi:hypothetical protein LCGC14_2145620, partial [marine sediment metagenome]